MPSSKNSDRRKRKYGEKQRARTAQNRETKKAAAQRRHDRLIQRTRDLIGTTVTARTGDGPLVGKVQEVMSATTAYDQEYPGEFKRPGQYVRVADQKRQAVVSRRRIKINK